MTNTAKPIPMLDGGMLENTQRFAENPPDFLVEIAREGGDIIGWKLPMREFVLVRDPEIIREILVSKTAEIPKDNRDLGLMQRIAGHGLLGTIGETHKRQRKLTQPAFHHKRIQNYASYVVEYTDRMIRKWDAGESRELSEDMLAITMFIISKILFDADMEEMADQVEAVGEAVDVLQTRIDEQFSSPIVLPMWIPTPGNRAIRKHRKMLDRTIEEMIRERQANPSDRGDLLSMLMMTVDEHGDQLTLEELRDQLLTLFLAGHETTSNALTWVWYLLSEHPEVEVKLHQELDEVLGDRLPTFEDLRALSYTEKVLKESMRLYPPAWGLTARSPKEDVVVGGYQFKKGQAVFISPYVNHRNPAYFEEPNRFNPDRFTSAFESSLPRYVYMPFGGGPHVCIGNSLAMLEGVLILAVMAQRFRFKLDPAQKIEMLPRITLSSRYGMRMTPTARSTVGSQAKSVPIAAD